MSAPRPPSCIKRYRLRQTAGFALADSALDGGRARAVSGPNDDPRPPDVLLRAVAFPDDRLRASPIRRRDFDDYSLAHAPQSHNLCRRKTLIRTLLPVLPARLVGHHAVIPDDPRFAALSSVYDRPMRMALLSGSQRRPASAAFRRSAENGAAHGTIEMSEADAKPLLQAGPVRAGAEWPEKGQLILRQSAGWRGSFTPRLQARAQTS